MEEEGTGNNMERVIAIVILYYMVCELVFVDVMKASRVE